MTCDFSFVTLYTWRANGLASIRTLASSSCKDLVDNNLGSEEILMLDFRLISSIVDHTWTEEALPLIITRPILCVNMEDEVKQSLKQETIEINASVEFDSNRYGQIAYHELSDNSAIICFVKDIGNTDWAAYEKIYHSEIEKKVEETIAESFTKNSEYTDIQLKSTPIYTNGKFNSAKIIADNSSLYFITVVLADFVEKSLQSRLGVELYHIISVSLRGAVFGSLVAKILSLPFVTIDHLGPIAKVHVKSDQFFNSSPPARYVLISDFVFLGTELKLADSVVKFNRSSINMVCSLGTLFEEDRYKPHTVKTLTQLTLLSTGAKYALDK